MQDTKQEPLAIDYQLAYNAYTGTSFSPERRAEAEIKSFAAILEDGQQQIREAASNPEAEKVAERLALKWGNKLHTATVAYLASRNGLMSTMITGASNFPVARMEKKHNTVDKRLSELVYIQKGKLEKYIRIVQNQKPANYSELEETKQRLADAEANQEYMKASNKTVRKALKLEPEAAAELMKAERLPVWLLEKDFAGRVGFAGYELTNNNALIKRLKAKVTDLERKEARIEEAATEGNRETDLVAFVMVENAEADRLQLVFDGKPSDGIRSWLKSRGFRWSRYHTAWQRKLTRNAYDDAKELAKAINEGELV